VTDLYPDPAAPAVDLLKTLSTCPPSGDEAADRLGQGAAALLDRLGQFAKLADLARLTRTAQRRYFATRTDDDLTAAKALEAGLDRALKSLPEAHP